MTDDPFPPLKPLTHRIRLTYALLRHCSLRPKMAFLSNKHSDIVDTIIAGTGVLIWSPVVILLCLVNYIWLPFKPLVMAFSMTEKQQKNIEDYLGKVKPEDADDL